MSWWSRLWKRKEEPLATDVKFHEESTEDFLRFTKRLTQKRRSLSLGQMIVLLKSWLKALETAQKELQWKKKRP